MSYIKDFLFSDYNNILQGIVILIILVFLAIGVTKAIKKDISSYAEKVALNKSKVVVYKNIREIVFEGKDNQIYKSYIFPSARWIAVKARRDDIEDNEQVLVIELK